MEMGTFWFAGGVGGWGGGGGVGGRSAMRQGVCLVAPARPVERQERGTLRAMRVSRFHRFEVVAVLVLTTAVWGYDQSLGPLGSFLLSERFGAVPVRMVAAWHAFREQGLSADVLAAALP